MRIKNKTYYQTLQSEIYHAPSKFERFAQKHPHIASLTIGMAGLIASLIVYIALLIWLS